MPFVIDASIVACWAFPDEDHPAATGALERFRQDTAQAPALWWFEVRNLLLTGERRARIAERDTAAFLQDLSRLGVTIDRAPDEAAVLGLARRHGLTAYDAAYLELALRGGMPLATLDKALIRAARAADVPLLA